jgi:hypothetical protein
MISPTHGTSPADRRPLPGAQPFAQQQETQHHVDQRIDEVSEAGFDHAIMVHRPDVAVPVDGEHDGAGGKAPHDVRIAHGRTEPRPLPAEAQDHQQEDQRPDHAVHQDLVGRDPPQHLEVDRDGAPHEIGRNRQEDAVLH